MKKYDIFATIVIPALFLFFSTWWIRFYDIDMQVQRHFWDESASLWRYAKAPWALNIYNLGVIPALLVGMISLVILLMGIGRQDIARYRKVAAYLVLTLLIGSGLITNALLKGMWGRPRPAQLIDFGGSQPFEPVLVWAAESTGKSFPCGHATMGFFFLSVALALPRRWWKSRILVGFFGVSLGVALGWVRSAQGGHFLSDTLWSAAVMWFVAVGLFHLLGLGVSRSYLPKKAFRRQIPTWAMFCYAPVIGLALLLCLLGTPYKESYIAPKTEATVRRVFVNVDGEVKLIRGDVFQIEAQSEGFGMPNSSQKFECSVEDLADLHIKGYRKGFFTELRVVVSVTVPAGHDVEIVCQGASRLINTKDQQQ